MTRFRVHDVAIAAIALIVIWAAGQALAGEQKVHELNDPVYVVEVGL